MISPVLLHTVNPHKVEFGTVWNTWVEATDVMCTEYSEGAGQVVGDAKLIRYLGHVAQPMSAIVTQTLTDRMGQYVRISQIESGTPVPVWWGVVTGDQLVDDGEGADGVGKGVQFLSCAGIASVLGQITIQRGIEGRYTSGSTPAAFINPGYLPPFNAQPRGDKETNSTTIDGATIYPHRRWAGPTAAWTEFNADAILSYLLRVLARGAYGVAAAPTGSVGPSGPTWDYSDIDSALGFVMPNLDLNGMSVLDAINTIINPRRGLIWRPSVNPTTGAITAQVRSISVSSITASGYTLPAASSATAINLATDAGVSDLQISRDASSCYDVITVSGARSWHALTLAYSRAFATDSYALTDGWLSANETALDDISDLKTSAPKELEDVYRRFVFRGEWTGRQWESGGGSTYGLPWVLTEGADGAITADLTFGGTVATSAQPHTLELTRELPCGVGFTDQPDGDRQPPLMFFVHGTDCQSWNGEDTLAPTRLQIDSNPPSITVSPANQPDLSDQINDSGSTLLFTVGIRAGRPLTYRWARAAGSRPRDVARSLVLNLPDCELWTVLPETVTLCGENPNAVPPITTGGIHTTGATEIIVRDDRPQLQAALALLVAYYSTPSVSLNFTVRDEAAHDAWCQPGTLITTATLGIGTVTCNAVVTRRTINLTESGWGTTYSCERFIPDVEAIR